MTSLPISFSVELIWHWDTSVIYTEASQFSINSWWIKLLALIDSVIWPEEIWLKLTTFWTLGSSVSWADLHYRFFSFEIIHKFFLKSWFCQVLPSFPGAAKVSICTLSLESKGETETSIGCLPLHLPRIGIDLATFWCTGKTIQSMSHLARVPLVWYKVAM